MPVAIEQPFQEIPTLDWRLVHGTLEEREKFKAELIHAIVNVGFMYLKNSLVTQAQVNQLLDYIPKVFDLPLETKMTCSMLNSPHFLGYSRQGQEFTKGARDNREQFDFATDYECKWKEGDEDWKRLWGPPSYPPEKALPGFQRCVVDYLNGVADLGFKMVDLIEECLKIPTGSLAQFYDSEPMQQRLKLLKYVDASNLRPEDGTQGVGPHFDHGLLTFLLQASSHPGLQVQNKAGQWIDAPPVPGTFVVNIGKALEIATQKVCIATSHRVISPPKGMGSRYSVPYFQSFSLAAKVNQGIPIPQDILDLKHARGETGAVDSVNYSEYATECNGQVQLIGRIKSHPDVGEKWYPELFKELFPGGRPSFGAAY
ncbi:Clavaminate synthase-like protein, partial [Calocera cornea HHB12733]